MEAKKTTANRDIIFAIRKIAGVDGLKNARFMTANVDSNAKAESDRVIDVSINLGNEASKITGVLLQSEPNDGFILIPKVGTEILICLMPDNSAFMVLCNDIDKVICVIDTNNKYTFDSNGFIFNGGLNAGMVKVIQLTAKINALENLVNNILNTLKTTVIPLAPSGTYPFATLYTAFNAIAPITQQSDIENTTVKH